MLYTIIRHTLTQRIVIIMLQELNSNKKNDSTQQTNLGNERREEREEKKTLRRVERNFPLIIVIWPDTQLHGSNSSSLKPLFQIPFELLLFADWQSTS